MLDIVWLFSAIVLHSIHAHVERMCGINAKRPHGAFCRKSTALWRSHNVDSCFWCLHRWRTEGGTTNYVLFSQSRVGGDQYFHCHQLREGEVALASLLAASCFDILSYLLVKQNTFNRHTVHFLCMYSTQKVYADYTAPRYIQFLRDFHYLYLFSSRLRAL